MLEFNIKNQTISRVDRFNPATDSVDYLTAKFNFISTDWDGVTKKALFRSGTVSYEAAISASGICKVPFEVLISPDNKFSVLSGGCIKIFVSVVGTSGTMTIPTKECRVEIGASGLTETLNGAEPTPDIYQQFVDTIKADNDTTVAEIKADNDETREEVETLTERAETPQTSAEQSAASMKNDYANALKGKVSGEVVRVDDVSPVEHNPTVRVYGKNLFYSNIDNSGLLSGLSYDISKNTSAVVLSGVVTQENALHLPDTFSLSKGTYTVSVVNLNSEDRVYLRNQTKGEVIINHIKPSAPKTFTLTEDVKIRTYIVFKENSTYDNTNVCIQIEKGDTATEYTPYIDPSTVTLTRCGKNFWHSRELTYPRTVSGVTVDYDPESQIYTFNGTSTSAGDIYTVPNGADIMRINKGEIWTLKVEVMGGNIDGVATSSGKISPLVNTSNYTNTIHANTEALYVTKTYTETADITKMYFYVYASGIVFNNFKCRIQFELNNKPTEFEKFKEMAEYTPEADGTCDIVSLSPTMTLLTDTEGVTVECEYNRDINKVIADILKKVGA